MPEKKEHADLRKIITNWVKSNFDVYNLKLIEDSPRNPLGYGVPPIGGRFPDLYGRSSEFGIEVIGEAKTSGDIIKEHTEIQFCKYLNHLSVFNENGYLIVAVPLQDKEEMANFIRKILRERDLDILTNIFIIDDIFKIKSVVRNVR
jgi:hypothetical protein